MDKIMTKTSNWSQLSKAWTKELTLEESSSSSTTTQQQQSQSQITAAMQRTLPLLEDPTAVPFVCRYRTDVIHPLSTSQVHQLSDMVQTYKRLESLRNRILDKLPSDVVDPTLLWRIQTSLHKSELEDLYAPYKPPNKGSLEDRIRQEHPELMPRIQEFWNSNNANDKNTISIAKLKPRDAAVTLLANQIASHTVTTDALLEYVARVARIVTTPSKFKDAKQQQDADKKYQTYYDFSTSFHNLQNHQVLAIRRGVTQKALKLSFEIDSERAESRIRRSLIDEGILPVGQNNNQQSVLLLWKDAIHDAWTRLLRKRCTNRLWKDQCARAETKSIHVFCDNLQKALLAPPLQPPRPVLALDPGFQAGIKCALLDANGQLLTSQTKKNAVSGLVTVSFLKNHEQGVQRLGQLLEAMKDHQDKQQQTDSSKPEQSVIVTVALGNGHGSQEARALVRESSNATRIPIDIQLVNEAGASVWSVTKGAKSEFPEEPPAAVAAVSIGRRFQNSLPELVKIPPRSLGLGMYQHDLSEKELDEKLHVTSVNAVAEVGVDANACSIEILEKVPGLTTTLAQRILQARPLSSREDLMSRVSGLGPKTFENCAAFVRIQRGKESLDGTLVHPESYELARYLLKTMQWDLSDPSSLQASDIPPTFQERGEKWSSTLDKASSKFDLPKDRVLSVLNHLVASMTNPDPRLGGGSEISIVGTSTMDGTSTSSSSGINAKVGSIDGCSALPTHLTTSMDDLRKACPYRGVTATVRNVVDFGVFVDFGAENDGLIHRSKLGSIPLSSLLVGQEIGVDILSVNADSHRISVALTGLNLNPDPERHRKEPKGSTKGSQTRSYSTTSKRPPNTSKSRKRQSQPKAKESTAKRRRVEKR